MTTLQWSRPWQPQMMPAVPTLPSAPSLADIEAKLAAGELGAAADEIASRLAADPADPEAWFLQARILQVTGRPAEAAEACQRALVLWPDVMPVHRLQLELARDAADPARAIVAIRALLAAAPDDPFLNGELALLLCQKDDYAAALPHLRIAAPVLLHENSTIWNYTVSLALMGRYDELVEIQPMLDRMAGTDHLPYTPYRQLAAAKLALRADRVRAVEQQRALEASPLWHDAMRVLDRVAAAVAAQDPFSLICLDHDLAHFVCATSLHAHLVLRPQELLAVASAAWEVWFDTSYQDTDPATVAALSGRFRAAIQDADIIGLPDAETIRLDNMHFGLLAEMQRLVLERTTQSFTSFQIARHLHNAMPFLRPVLQGQPFLGLVGGTTTLLPRLAHFCGIAGTLAILPTDPDLPGGQGSRAIATIEAALADLAVPFRGALFLVALPGPYGAVFCNRIKALGGIALDIATLSPSWAAR